MLSIENRGKEMEESRVEAGIAIQTANTDNLGGSYRAIHLISGKTMPSVSFRGTRTC